MTSAAAKLTQTLAATLSTNHDVVLTDRLQAQTSYEFVCCELGHDRSTNDLVRGMDVIILSGEPDPQASVSDQLDVAMRCTYNLLSAAVDEGVPRLVYLSSLSLLDKYDEDLALTESWRPLPTTDPRDLCYHLGEFVCKEFDRQGKITIERLRLGALVWPEDEARSVSTSALYVDDAAVAVESSLTADLPRWGGLFHIQSNVPHARYLTQTETGALGTLGFSPRRRE